MKAMIVGAGGQLGQALAATAPEGWKLLCCDRQSLDITDAEKTRAQVLAVSPDLLLNAGAYTAVDRAESEERAAFAINALAVRTLADAARAAGSQFVHVSTDFVFDGRSSTPYAPDSPPNPLGVYGRSKLEGERLAGPDALIVRTAWVYGRNGGNFVRTMLRLMTERPEIRVVADQIGTPTYVPSLARAIWILAMKKARGLYHYSDAGVASWYDFAVAIQEEACTIGLLKSAIPILPIATEDYPTPARRPAFSVLDKRSTLALTGLTAVHWRENLRSFLKDLKDNG
ncbi:MAG: dTDP-4-dehydrorhamnose reductase [Sphingobium sp.]